MYRFDKKLTLYTLISLERDGGCMLMKYAQVSRQGKAAPLHAIYSLDAHSEE